MAKTPKLYVATESFFTSDGDVYANITHATGDSDLYKRFPDKFKEVEPHFRGVEQATAAPGEVRQVELPPEEESVEEKGSRK